MSRESRKHLMELVKFQRDAWRKITPPEMHDFYASDDDIESMKEWPIKKCDSILEEIVVFTLDQECGSIDWSTNPFCQFHEVDCEKCEYGKKHGKCGERTSERNKLQIYFRDNDVDEFDALSNKMYRKFFKKLGLKVPKNRKTKDEE